jgi:hypothetical protein
MGDRANSTGLRKCEVYHNYIVNSHQVDYEVHHNYIVNSHQVDYEVDHNYLVNSDQVHHGCSFFRLLF